MEYEFCPNSTSGVWIPHPSLSKENLAVIYLIGYICKNWKKDKKYVGKIVRVLLSEVSLPPFDKYIHFHHANLLSIFSKTKFQIVLALNLAPKARPKYFIRDKVYSSYIFLLDVNFENMVCWIACSLCF